MKNEAIESPNKAREDAVIVEKDRLWQRRDGLKICLCAMYIRATLVTKSAEVYANGRNDDATMAAKLATL